MKNFKKVIAAAAAVAMTMSIGVSAMAATTASYADGKVTLANVGDTVNSANQWTVIVIAADKANATLEAADLYYINQGDNGEAFWTNGLGVKTDLAAGDYIVRIGGEDLAQVVEIPFTVATTPVGETYWYGDIDGYKGVDSYDALEIMLYEAGMESVFMDYTVGDGSWIWIAADIDGYEGVDSYDALEIMLYEAGMESVFDTMESKSFVK